MTCSRSSNKWLAKPGREPKPPDFPSSAPSIHQAVSRLSLLQYSLCKQGRQYSDRLCLRAILIALLFS